MKEIDMATVTFGDLKTLMGKVHVLVGFSGCTDDFGREYAERLGKLSHLMLEEDPGLLLRFLFLSEPPDVSLEQTVSEKFDGEFVALEDWLRSQGVQSA